MKARWCFFTGRFALCFFLRDELSSDDGVKSCPMKVWEWSHVFELEHYT